MTKISIVNGPNLNLLGQREPDIYGSNSLDSLEKNLTEKFEKKASLEFFQSNHEGLLIDYIQKLEKTDAIIINPGAFTHSSIALRDCILAKKIPTIEVHISNIFAREDFRKKSYFSDICQGSITGLGPIGYDLAIRAILGSDPVPVVKSQ